MAFHCTEIKEMRDDPTISKRIRTQRHIQTKNKNNVQVKPRTQF